jgi:hypothetical protein
VREEVASRAPALSEDETAALARVAGGRLDRVERLLDPKAADRRVGLLAVARSVYRDPDFRAGDAAEFVTGAAAESGAQAKSAAEDELEHLDLPTREAEQRVRRAQRGREREELLLMLEELAAWYRDLAVVAAGADGAAVHYDHLDELREDATPERSPGAERAAELVRETWRSLEEFNIQPGLAFEALFLRLRRAFASSTHWVAA